MRGIKLFIVLLCCSITMALLGCCKNDRHILDGPGMVYEQPWTAFTISRSDSSMQYTFWFTVSDDGDQPLVIGECYDEKGNFYEEEIGIVLSAEDLWQLRWMDLQMLDAPIEFPEDLEPILDDSKITLSLVLPSGETVEKNASGDLSMEIYQLLLPYFKK